MSVVHATAVRLDGLGVLIRGPSGSGKSRLAIALLEGALPVGGMELATDDLPRPTSKPLALQPGSTALIGDDYLHLVVAGSGIIAAPAKGLEGLVEVRGLGIAAIPWCTDAPIHLAVDLVPSLQMVRLPEDSRTDLLDQKVSQLCVPVGDLAHQLLLVRLALKTLVAKQ